ncbi:BURP domain protein RD22 [Bienertia sinuspersici]
MDSCILRIIFFLYLAIVTCHASILLEDQEGGTMNGDSMVAPNNQEDYWKQQLGENTKMPKAIKDAIYNGQWTEVIDIPADIEQDVVQSSNRRTMRGHAHVSVGPNNGVKVRAKKHGGGHANVDVSKSKGVKVNAGKNGKGADVQVGHDGVFVNAGTKQKPVYVGVKPDINPFQYEYTKKQQQQRQQQQQQQQQVRLLRDTATRALFFLEKDMKLGHEMNLYLTKRFNNATFLPREKANSLPFSSDKLLSILREFSMEPGSEEAQVIENTIRGCEHKGIKGEQKYCATSLESLVDYAKKMLGKHVRAMSTEVENMVDKVQKYTIATIKKVTSDNEPIVCHKQNYAYAVFYCHKTKGTSAYVISLKGINGTNAKSMAVCHKDTSNWNPQHLAFEVLNVKPGRVPICHFLPEDHLVWVPY